MTRRGLLLCLLLSCFSFLLWGTADAKAITVDAKGEYLLTLDVDSPTVAREKAREQARRNATEMGGVYVKAYSETEKLALTKDKVTMLTGSILEIIAEKFSMEPINDNTINVVCHIKANIDTDKINPEKLLQQEEQLQKIAEQNKRIQELEREAELIKKQNAELLKSAQNQEIKERLNENQRQFLIAKYERDIDIYDFGNAKNLQERMDLAQKLIAIDPQNKEAFRCMAAYFRQQNDIPGLMNYCQKTLNNSPSTNLMIEAYTQLGDIYYNERNDKAQALSYINKGIALVKQNYTPAEIEDMVNGGNVMIKMSELTGRTNVVRELYVLKSDIEGYIPHFECLTIVKEEQLEDDKIFNIRYKTNW